jgi:hypothetical protein
MAKSAVELLEYFAEEDPTQDFNFARMSFGIQNFQTLVAIR